MTGRDGYLKIANCNPHYQGMNSDVVCENDVFEKRNDFILHQYKANDRGKITGAYAVVFRDDRVHPAYFFAPMRDYFKDMTTWRQYPHAMILKVAEAMALKRAFSISGLVTVEEVDDGSQKKMRTQAIWVNFLKIYRDKDSAIKAIQSLVGVKPSASWTEDDLKTLEEKIFSQGSEAQILDVASVYKGQR